MICCPLCMYLLLYEEECEIRQMVVFPGQYGRRRKIVMHVHYRFQRVDALFLWRIDLDQGDSLLLHLVHTLDIVKGRLTSHVVDLFLIHRWGPDSRYCWFVNDRSKYGSRGLPFLIILARLTRGGVFVSA